VSRHQAREEVGRLRAESVLDDAVLEPRVVGGAEAGAEGVVQVIRGGRHTVMSAIAGVICSRGCSVRVNFLGG
jgi:RNase P/RNase MRP subunit POP5